MAARRTDRGLPPGAGRLLQEYLAQLCPNATLNLVLAETLLSDQCHLRIGNAPPTLGKAAVLRELGAFVSEMEAIGQGYFDAWRSRDTVILELDGVITCPAGLRVTVPCAAILRLTDGMVDDIRIYIERSGPPPVPDAARRR